MLKTPLCFNPFPNKPWFLRVCRTSLSKTLWKREKLLVTSNFSFSHSVFSPFGKFSAIFIKFETAVRKFFQFGRVQNLSFGNELTLPILPVQGLNHTLRVEALENSLGKIDDHYHFSPSSYFFSIERIQAHLY